VVLLLELHGIVKRVDKDEDLEQEGLSEDQIVELKVL